jgi:DUF1680 family protein
VETDQPWEGSVAIVMESAPAGDWSLSVRLPAWLEAGSARIAGEPAELDPTASVLVAERTWSIGDRVELDLEMPPRWTLPHPAIDAVRDCAAIERGPLVYCVEQTDLPAGAGLDDVEVEVDAPPTLIRAKDMPDEIPAVSVQGRVRSVAADRPPWPYAAKSDVRATPGADVAVTAVPYFAWANRETGPMRVWLPISRT